MKERRGDGWFWLEREPAYEDAMQLLVTKLQGRATTRDTIKPGRRTHLSVGEIIGECIQLERKADIEAYVRTTERATPQLDRETNSHSFFEAAWELVRRGILAPMVTFDQQSGQANGMRPDQFWVTPFGLEWAAAIGTLTILPVQHERFLDLLLEHAPRFGPVYAVRCREAVHAYRQQLYLSCLTMSGGAAEAILVCLGTEHAGSREALASKVFPRFRRTLLDYVLEPLKGPTQQELRECAEAVKYWRDDAAHANERELDETHAFISLRQLARLANRVGHGWDELAAQLRPRGDSP